MERDCQGENSSTLNGGQTVFMMLNTPLHVDSHTEWCTAKPAEPNTNIDIDSHVNYNNHDSESRMRVRPPYTPNLKRTPQHFNFDLKDSFRPRAASDKLPDLCRRSGKTSGDAWPTLTFDLSAAPGSKFSSRNHRKLDQRPRVTSCNATEFTVEPRGDIDNVSNAVRESTIAPSARGFVHDTRRVSREFGAGRVPGRPRTCSDSQLNGWHVTSDSVALLDEFCHANPGIHGEDCQGPAPVARKTSEGSQKFCLGGKLRENDGSTLLGGFNCNEERGSDGWSFGVSTDNGTSCSGKDNTGCDSVSSSSDGGSSRGNDCGSSGSDRDRGGSDGDSCGGGGRTINSDTETTNPNTHFEGSSHQEPSSPATTTIQYLTVPSRWKSRVSNRQLSERRHSSYTRGQQYHHQYPQYHQDQHAPDEPLLQPSPEEEMLSPRASSGSYLLTSKTAIWLSTRVVLLLLLLLGTTVVITSLWFMLKCQARFEPVQPLLPNNSTFCRTMGMPGLFAACTLLFTVCGLACTGRKFTGYALIVISGVEILQSVTTLTFYNCRVLSAGSVLASVNDSLLKCQAAVQPSSSTSSRSREGLGQFEALQAYHTGRGSAWEDLGDLPARDLLNFPFDVREEQPSHSSTPLQEALDSNSRGRAVKGRDAEVASSKLKNGGKCDMGSSGREAKPKDKDSSQEQGALNRNYQGVENSKAEQEHDQSTRTIATGVRRGKQQTNAAGIRREKRETTRHFSDANLGQEISMLSRGASRGNILQHRVDCRPDSQFFQILKQTSSEETFTKCRSVCETYQAVCEVSWEGERSLLHNYGYYAGKRSLSDMVDPLSPQAHRRWPLPQYASRTNHAGSGKQTQAKELKGNQEFWGRRGGRAVQQCGRRVEQRVNNLCFFDNQVILPMSLGAPVIYIVFSCCFIYLARCEKARKMAAHCSKMARSGSTSSALTQTPIMRSRAGSAVSEDLKMSIVLARFRRWCARLVRRQRRKSFQQNSQSSQELLQLNTVMYSIYAIVGPTMIEQGLPVENV